MVDEQTFHFRGYDIPVRLCRLTGGGPDTFEAISDMHIHNVNAACGFRSDLNVMEIGCGIGRDAIPLTSIIGEHGRYVGTDVIYDSVLWCSHNISQRHPNFTFIHQDIHDALHNPSGTATLEKTDLPMDDDWADLIVLQSVFTHMLSNGVVHYLAEFARILRKGGLVYATVFLVNDEILDVARRTNLTPWNLRFEHMASDGVFINDPKHPTGAVAYREDVLRTLIDRAGLKLVGPIRLGAWSGAHSLAFDAQDVVVLRRKD